MHKINKFLLLSSALCLLSSCGGEPTNNDNKQEEEQKSEPITTYNVNGLNDTLVFGNNYDVSNVSIDVLVDGVKTETITNLFVNTSTLNNEKVGEYTLNIHDNSGKIADQNFVVNVVPNKKLKILMVGNQTTLDIVKKVPELLAKYNDSEIEIDCAHFSDATIDGIYESFSSNANKFVFTSYDLQEKIWNVQNDKQLNEILNSKAYDYVSFEQESLEAANMFKFSNLKNLVTLFKNFYGEKTQPKLFYNFTWAYSSNSNNATYLQNYASGRDAMFESMLSAFNKVVAPMNDFDKVLFSGVFVQNLRTSFLSDKEIYTSASDTSLSFPIYGVCEYLLETFTGLDCSSTYEGTIKESYINLIKEAKDNVKLNSSTITQSKYLFDPGDNIEATRNNALKYVETLIRTGENRTFSSEFVKTVKDILNYEFLVIKNSTTVDSIINVVSTLKDRIKSIQDDYAGEEIAAAKSAFESKGDVTGTFSFSNDNGKISQPSMEGWTRIRFGEQNGNDKTVFECDITPRFKNANTSLLTIRYREWDTSNNLYMIVNPTSIQLGRLYWSDNLSMKVEDESFQEALSYDKFTSGITHHIKIMCSGWTKTVMIDDDVVVNRVCATDCVGYFSIESWETAYDLENPMVKKYSSQDDLVADYPEIWDSRTIKEAEDYPIDENLSEVLKGKNFSILGDSISTFAGYSNDVSSNSTIGNNVVYYQTGSGLASVKETWWSLVEQATQMDVLVNNSWSGSRATATSFDDLSSGVVSRCENLHSDVGSKNGTKPDVIVVYLGTNDLWGENLTPAIVTPAFEGKESIFDQSGDYVNYLNNFTLSYAVMIDKIQKAYPEADVFACTCLPNTSYSSTATRLVSINNAIRAISEDFGLTLVDIQKSCDIITKPSEYTVDEGHIHPNKIGMEALARCVLGAMSNYYCAE